MCDQTYCMYISTLNSLWIRFTPSVHASKDLYTCTHFREPTAVIMDIKQCRHKNIKVSRSLLTEQRTSYNCCSLSSCHWVPWAFRHVERFYGEVEFSRWALTLLHWRWKRCCGSILSAALFLNPSSPPLFADIDYRIKVAGLHLQITHLSLHFSVEINVLRRSLCWVK